MPQETVTTGGKGLRIAIVGCGAVSELYYAPVLAGLGKEGAITVSALVDPLAERRAALGRFFPDAAQVSDIHALGAASIEAAIVASPHQCHAPQAIALLEAGCHVLCEKPMADTVFAAREMIAAAERTGMTLAIGHIRRFHPAARAMEELIRTGVFGSVRHARCVEGHRAGWPVRSDALYRKESHGVLTDLGIHWLDLLLWWFGPPDDCTYRDDALGGIEANCRLEATFGNVATELFLSRSQNLGSRGEVVFDDGCVIYDPNEPTILRVDGANAIRGQLRLDGPEDRRCFASQVRDFLEAVDRGRPPRVTGWKALSSIALVERCYAERQALAMDWLPRNEVDAIQRLM